MSKPKDLGVIAKLARSLSAYFHGIPSAEAEMKRADAARMWLVVAQKYVDLLKSAGYAPEDIRKELRLFLHALSKGIDSRSKIHSQQETSGNHIPAGSRLAHSNSTRKPGNNHHDPGHGFA